MDFRGDDSITRGEAAKFVNQYAQVLGLEQNYTACTFDDIAEYDYTLVPHIYEACKFGLLKGSQGKFMPNGNVSPAQAITIVVKNTRRIPR
ncbi:MAG: S-layer homology domain-containing protein [Candidatus Peribacteria bacterium]|nr:MAG: S-layer homology domain-containing protein [Candidatus Peribacteria bacterium]